MKTLWILAPMALTANLLYGQNPSFSQFYANPLYTNPALAGAALYGDQAAGRAVLNYGSNSSGKTIRYQGLTAGFDQLYDKLHGGVGIQYTGDYYGNGIVSSNSITAMYSYAAKIGEAKMLRIGAQLGIVRRGVNLSKAGAGSDQQASVPGFSLPYSGGPSPSASIRYPNIGIGMLYEAHKFYFGAAIHNLNQPSWSFYKNPEEYVTRLYTLHAGFNFVQPDGKLVFSPQVIYNYQKNLNQMLGGFNVQYGRLMGGLWVRSNFGQFQNSDQGIFNVGYNTGSFRIMASRDLYISEGRSSTALVHNELSVCYRWGTKQQHTIPFSPLY